MIKAFIKWEMKIGIIGATGFIGSNLKKNFSYLDKTKDKIYSFSSFKKNIN